MNAIVFERTGGPEVLALSDVPKPDVRPGMALIKVHAIGVNFADVRFRQGLYVADEGIQWRTRRKHRCRTGIQQLLHVGLRDGAADDHRDVAGVRGSQCVDGAGGQGHMGARQDRQPDKLDVLLQSDRNNVLDALANSGVDDFESGVAERALFVLDRGGTIHWSYVSPLGVNPGADGILEALDSLPEQGGRHGDAARPLH